MSFYQIYSNLTVNEKRSKHKKKKNIQQLLPTIKRYQNESNQNYTDQELVLNKTLWQKKLSISKKLQMTQEIKRTQQQERLFKINTHKILTGSNNESVNKIEKDKIKKQNSAMIPNILKMKEQKLTLTEKLLQDNKIEQKIDDKIQIKTFRTTFNIRKETSNKVNPNLYENTDIIQKQSQRFSSLTNMSTNISKKRIGNYTIIKQLGKGGFAQVYQVIDNRNQLKYALKQYSLVESFQCYKNQIKVGQTFFQSHKIKPGFQSSEGIQNIVQYRQKLRLNKKGYIVQQSCGVNLSKLISHIKGTFFNKQRVYQVHFQPFYQKIKQKTFFKSFLLQICSGIKLLNENGFVHCDLKLENILISDFDHKSNQEQNPLVKIIDFGSTFFFSEGLPKITITPQYMPPQLLCQFDSSLSSCQIDYQKVDIWSIGCILLQIFTGVPLWFKYKCKVNYYGRQTLQLGIFSLTNRDYSKIIKKQKELCHQIINHITFSCKEFQTYRTILKKIFVIDTKKRITIDNLMREIQSIK